MSTEQHKRRPRYKGKSPRRFSEKYKELVPERYAADVAKVIASGRTPAGSHRPIMVREVLEVLAPQPGELAVQTNARVVLMTPGAALSGYDFIPGAFTITMKGHVVMNPSSDSRSAAGTFRG